MFCDGNVWGAAASSKSWDRAVLQDNTVQISDSYMQNHYFSGTGFMKWLDLPRWRYLEMSVLQIRKKGPLVHIGPG